MAQSLETYVAQATQAYQPAYNAIQTQLDSLSGNLATAENKINKNYAQQQAGLNRARNAAAETASMQAAGSGGSFGGAANIANRKYYEQSFVPAQTQMNTNKANELEQARQDSENQRTSLNAQRANLEAQAQQAALQQYWAAVEAEKEREAQRRLAAQQNAAQNAYYNALMKSMQNAQSSGGVKTWDFGNGYKVYDNGGEAMYTLNGNQISRGKFLEGTGGNTQWNLWNDIWNSGTKTNGVGSDTVQAYKNFYKTTAPYLSGNKASLQSSSKYGYLY